MGNAASNFFVADNKKQAASDFLDEKLVRTLVSLKFERRLLFAQRMTVDFAT